MATKKRQPKRHLRSVPPPPTHEPAGKEQSLLQGFRTALRSAEPHDLLAMVSSLLEVTDPRSRNPFAPDEQRASLGELVESFVGTSFAETTAAARTDGRAGLRACRRLRRRAVEAVTSVRAAGSGVRRCVRSHARFV